MSKRLGPDGLLHRQIPRIENQQWNNGTGQLAITRLRVPLVKTGTVNVARLQLIR
jgi:hypothetical protein